MNGRWLTLAALITVAPVAPVALYAGGGREQTLHVYYTSSLNGNLDGCTCGSEPKAGLVKRAAFLRGRHRADSILLDTGDILDTTPDLELSAAVLSIYQELGYDAVGVGDQELADGGVALKGYTGEYPLISHNLALLSTGSDQPLTAAPLTLSRGRLAIRIIALLDPQVFALYPRSLRSQIAVTPPAEALERLVAVPVASKDETAALLTILIYHGPVEAAAALVAGRTDIDLVVVGHEQRLVHPQKAGAAIIVSPGEQGNRVGVLDLVYRDGRIAGYSHVFRLFDYRKDPDDAGVRRRIEEMKTALRAKTKEG